MPRGVYKRRVNKVYDLRDKAVKSLENAANFLEKAKPDIGQTTAVDLNQLRETHYRRGLVTAMECILRELR